MSKVSTNGDIIVDFANVIPNPEKSETIIPPKAYKFKKSSSKLENYLSKKLSGEGYISKEGKQALAKRREKAAGRNPSGQDYR